MYYVEGGKRCAPAIANIQGRGGGGAQDSSDVKVWFGPVLWGFLWTWNWTYGLVQANVWTLDQTIGSGPVQVWTCLNL